MMSIERCCHQETFGVDGTCVPKDVTTGIHCGHQGTLTYAGELSCLPRLEAAPPACIGKLRSLSSSWR